MLKIIEVNKPDEAYVRQVLAKAFIRTHGAEKVKAALELKEKNKSK